MKFVFVEESWEDYLYWQKTDKKKLKRINELLKDISRNPFEGIANLSLLNSNIPAFGQEVLMKSIGLSIK